MRKPKPLSDKDLPEGITVFRRKIRGKEMESYRVRISAKVTGTTEVSRTFPADKLYDARKWHADEMAKYKKEGAQAYQTLGGESQRAEVVQCLKLIANLPHKVSLLEVVQYYIARMAPAGKRLLSDAFSDFQNDPERAKQSVVHRENVDREVRRLDDALPGIHVHEVLPSQILSALANATDPKTFNNKRGNLSAFFEWCRRHKYLAENPVNDVDIPTRETTGKTPGILRPDEVRQLLHGALEHGYSDLIPGFAISLFGCVRRAEAIRLKWRDVHGHATILDGSVTKTKQHRSAGIHPTLTAWLERVRGLPDQWVIPYSDLDQWPVGPRFDWTRYPSQEEALEHHCANVERHRRTALCDILDLKWPDNCLRHSCASYHIAAGDLDDVELSRSMGHSIAMLHGRYKNLVSKTSAQEFFAILPPEKNQ